MNYEFRLFIMNFYSTVLSVKFSSLTRPGVSGSESGLWGNPRESEEARCSAEPALFSGCESNFGPRDHNNTPPQKKPWFRGESMDFMDLGAISSLSLVTSIWLMPAFLKLGVHLNTHTEIFCFFFLGSPILRPPWLNIWKSVAVAHHPTFGLEFLTQAIHKAMSQSNFYPPTE